MLKNVDPLLSPDALYALCSMGHGDEVVICDSHYPSEAVGKLTGYGKVVRMDGADTRQAFRAVLSVLELDSQFVEHPAERMMVDNQPDAMPHVQQEAQYELDAATGAPMRFGVVPRQDFYGRSKKAFLMIQTGETRGWGCFILRKGLIVTPDAPASAGNSHINHYEFFKEDRR
jgi:L-fucose mutarotase